MSILLVRHGETDGNAQRVLQRPDIPLNALGLRQAERIAARLQAFGAAAVIASDLTRALMTAEPIARARGLAIESTALLAERNFGDLRGRPYASLGEDPFAPDFVPPGGESWDEFHARVAEAFARVVRLRAELEGPLVVVTHGLVCRALAQRHLQLSAEQALPDRFHNTSLTIVDASAPHAVQLLNCTEHLVAADGGAGAGPDHESGAA